jgi:Heparinase II/III-like protein/Heparinase II/III N-terminus
VEANELVTALGGLPPADALRGRALSALPTVASFARRLAKADEAARADLIARADAVVAHRFDLLGSGPVELGPEIDWTSDFRTGRRWPLVHHSRIRASYGDGSDIKRPWELSRGQHLPLLAAAHRLTGERRYLDELGAQLRSWIAANPVERGPNWACTMDVAIRAANWVAALALCAEEVRAEAWLDDALRSLVLHGRFIRSHPEYALVRGNHYLADVAGLLVVASVFASGEGRAWADWAVGELEAEMAHQVRPDGADHEASIPYHRLVTELFVCGTQAADALAPGRLGHDYRERLGRMLQLVADYTRPDGLAPLIGDSDDGRFLPLDDYGRDPRSHTHLFEQAGTRPEPGGNTAYAAGGYYVLRERDLYVLVRCGDTGRYGLGGHGHNDQLSFELAFDGRPLVVDPGSYVYTSDPAERNRFRSTGFHSTLRVGGGEQNELRSDDLFLMANRAQAHTLVWQPPVFEGRHHGFESLNPPATHTRRLELDADERTLTITDTVESAGAHELEWTFPLAPSEAEVRRGVARALFEGVELEVDGEGLDFRVDEGWYSPRYGVRVPAPFVRATRKGKPGRDQAVIVLRVAR